MKLTQNDLLVLGLLLERPMHGYDIDQSIRGEEIEQWFVISSAAIYYSLGKLSRLGLIAKAQPRETPVDRAVYRVTNLGREEFLTEMEGLLDSTEPIRTDYDLGIYMLNRLPRMHAEALLRRRIDFLREWAAALEQSRSDVSPLRETMTEHAIAVAQLDIDWLVGIADRLATMAECEPYAEGLMKLEGDLHESRMPDLVKLIAAGRHSGTLLVTQDQVSRTVTFDQGTPYCASSQVAGKPELDGDRVLGGIYELFGWQSGTYVFDQRRCPREGCVQLEISADALILGGARRLGSWEVIQRVVPASTTLFEARDGGDRQVQLLLTEVESSVLAIVDGTRDISGLAQACGLTEFEVSRILYGLAEVDLIEPADPDRGRLRRVFRECAELLCLNAAPLLTTLEEAAACEEEVSRRCNDLPIAIRDRRIFDDTPRTLKSGELADVYRGFLHTQVAVLSERLGQDVADELRRQVLGKISRSLRETVAAYDLL